MKVLQVVIILVLCVLASSSPIIRVKTINGQKKSYCCYGVVRPFDMMAKAKQGLRALNQVGFSLKQVRKALGIQQEKLEGKLEKAEKKAEDISAKARKALRETMEILQDAVKRAGSKLSQMADVSNDLGQLKKDLEETKSRDMISKIRDLIAENPMGDEKAKDKEKNKNAAKENDQEKNKKKGKSLKPKDDIPAGHSADEDAVARSLVKQEKYQNDQVKFAKDAIDEKSQENKRAIEKTKSFLQLIENGLLEFQNGD